MPWRLSANKFAYIRHDINDGTSCWQNSIKSPPLRCGEKTHFVLNKKPCGWFFNGSNGRYALIVSYQFLVISFQLFSAVWRDFFNRLRASSPRRLARPRQPRPQPGRYALNTGKRERDWGRWMPHWEEIEAFHDFYRGHRRYRGGGFHGSV